MGTITINPTLNQSNKPWTLTWKASGRYPIVADRIYSTLAQAQAYVDDKSATASAIPGLVISVVDDAIAKNNGVYYVESIANSKADAGFPIADKGVLVKVGGTETETAKNYSAAVTLSQTLVTGQLIKVSEQETITTGEGESAVSNTYKAGFYIVETPGTISALDTSTGAADEIGALKTRVDALENNRVKVSDFNTYKSEVSGALDAKAGLDEFNAHKNNANIHVTSEDKTKWNNAEDNAKAYTDTREAEIDKKWAAADAALKSELEQYADQAEADAVSTSKKYTDTVVGAYTDGDVLATGIRKEIEDSVKDVKAYADQAEIDAVSAAKAYTDGRETAIDAKWAAADADLKSELQGEIATAKSGAESAAKAYTDGRETAIDAKWAAADADLKSELQGEIATAKSGAESVAKAYTDERETAITTAYEAYADQAETDAVNAAKAYTDEVVGNYAEGETVASGLRKEIAEKVAAVAADAKTYSVVAVAGDELSALGANVKEAYKLVDEDSVKAGDYIKIYKDSALQSVELDGQSLKFTYLLVDGTTSVVPVDVSAFLAESEFGDGLEVVNHIVSVKVADDSEAFLTVDENGVKLSGVQTAINTAKSGAETAANSYTDTEIGKLDGKAQGYANAAETAANSYTDAEIVKVNKTITDNESANSTAHTGLENRIKANEDAIKVINGTEDGSISKAAIDAKEAAIAQAKLDAAEALKAYMTKAETEAAIKVVSDALDKEIEDRTAADATLKSDLEKYADKAEEDAIKAANEYTDAEISELDGKAQGYADAAKTYADNAVETAVGNYAEGETVASGLRKEIAERDAIVDVAAQGYANAAQGAAQGYAKTYTDALFESFKFADTTDIDGLFEVTPA